MSVVHVKLHLEIIKKQGQQSNVNFYLDVSGNFELIELYFCIFCKKISMSGVRYVTLLCTEMKKWILENGLENGFWKMDFVYIFQKQNLHICEKSALRCSGLRNFFSPKNRLFEILLFYIFLRKNFPSLECITLHYSVYAYLQIFKNFFFEISLFGRFRKFQVDCAILFFAYF